MKPRQRGARGGKFLPPSAVRQYRLRGAKSEILFGLRRTVDTTFQLSQSHGGHRPARGVCITPPQQGDLRTVDRLATVSLFAQIKCGKSEYVYFIVAKVAKKCLEQTSLAVQTRDRQTSQTNTDRHQASRTFRR